MRRIRYEDGGAPDGGLFLEEVPVPEPAAGELLVEVAAVGVTLPVVRKVRAGGPPVPLGGEVAGEVVRVGEGVTGFAPGDRVTGLCFGHGYADFALLNSAMAVRVPAQASAREAVALVRSGVVALGALEAAQVARGESVLITAAASGVGHLAVQLARLRGAGRVVGAVGDPAKADFVRSLGADDAVAYGDSVWGEPYDAVLDAVGGELLGPAVRALVPGGRLVAYSSGGGTIERTTCWRAASRRSASRSRGWRGRSRSGTRAGYGSCGGSSRRARYGPPCTGSSRSPTRAGRTR